MTPLNELESKIRQALPRLMEISVGCMLQLIKGENVGGIYIIGNNAWVKNNKAYIELSDGYDYEITDFGIIGHEIYLSDVLEWLFETLDYSATDYKVIDLLIYWDLSKPLLKDQPKEVIDYLNGLK